jgi:hypothetical protein
VVRAASGGVVVLAVAFLAAWAVRVLTHRGSLDHFNAVRSLETIPPPAATPFVVAAAALLTGLVLWRRRTVAGPRLAGAAVGMTLLAYAAPFLTVVGHQVLILVVAGALAALAGLLGPEARRAPRPHPRWLPWALWAGVAAVHAAYSVHRQAWYGAGSWDHGCMIHNFYLASRFLPTTSTVLGEVDFLGDHFMVGIYLYAPLFWAAAGGTTVLLIQAVNLAAAAPAIFLIARHHKVGVGAATVLALTTALSFGLQSAAYFDSHEITVGFGFLAWGLWAFETGRLRAATALLFTFALFKESLGAYVVGLGLLALWRGARQRDRRQLVFGAAWILGGAVWFVLVNRVFMPTLIARANAPEPHETFGDFGPTVFAAALGIATHPVKALAAVFVPDPKLASLGVTLGGTGGLALLSPQVGLAALPLLAERFLSSKETMWEMGYHYAASLSLYAGWAAARGYPFGLAALRRALRRLGGTSAAARAPGVAAVYLVLAALGILGLGYKHPSNYFRWSESYFASPETKVDQDAAVALVEAQGRGARVAAQNRILPLLADRPAIYRLGEWQKADWVVLTVGASAWPYDDGGRHRGVRPGGGGHPPGGAPHPRAPAPRGGGGAGAPEAPCFAPFEPLEPAQAWAATEPSWFSSCWRAASRWCCSR